MLNFEEEVVGFSEPSDCSGPVLRRSLLDQHLSAAAVSYHPPLGCRSRHPAHRGSRCCFHCSGLFHRSGAALAPMSDEALEAE